MRRKIILFNIAFVLNLLFLINIGLSQWVNVDVSGGSGGINCLTSFGTNIYAGTRYTVNFSSNNGNTWSQSSGLNSQSVNALAVGGSFIFAGTSANGTWLPSVFYSSNGMNWIGIGLEYKTVRSLAISGNNIYAGVQNDPSGYGGLYLSTNNGLNWSKIGLNDLDVIELETNGNNIYASTYNRTNSTGSFFFSSNNGYNWLQSSINNNYLICGIKFYGNNIYVAAYNPSNYIGGIYYSTNNGINWTSINNMVGEVGTIQINGNNFFVGTNYKLSNGTGGVFYSTNIGTSWLRNNPNFVSNEYINKILIANNYIFAGSSVGIELWRRPLSEIIGIQNISKEIPIKYSLSQNYPNPFNPSTSIRFEVSRLNNIKIVVYDVMGHEIKNLVNESLQPGTYETSFDGYLLNSGIYFYKFTAGDYSETKRMLLIK